MNILIIGVGGPTIRCFVKASIDNSGSGDVFAPVNVNNGKFIGGDIAVTENGSELIEGNHNWCKLLRQLPNQVGIKNIN